MLRYLVRLNCETVLFEEISEKIFTKRQHALNEEGNGPRYFNDQFICIRNNRIVEMRLSECSPVTLGYICRACGVTIPTDRVDGGFVRTPTHVRFNNPRSKSLSLIEVATGNEYVQKAA